MKSRKGGDQFLLFRRSDCTLLSWYSDEQRKLPSYIKNFNSFFPSISWTRITDISWKISWSLFLLVFNTKSLWRALDGRIIVRSAVNEILFINGRAVISASFRRILDYITSHYWLANTEKDFSFYGSFFENILGIIIYCAKNEFLLSVIVFEAWMLLRLVDGSKLSPGILPKYSSTEFGN